MFFTLDINDIIIYISSIWNNPAFPTLQKETIKSAIFFLFFFKTASRYAVENGSENMLAVLAS